MIAGEHSIPMRSKNDFLIYAVIGIVAFCAFANTLGHGFVYDDTRQILGNPLIQRSELYGKALTSDVWAFKGGNNIAASNYFRPTFVAWLIVNWRLFGASALGWHFGTVMLHVIVCLLLFGFLLRVGCERKTAATIAIVFAVHPVHVESVAWISGVTDPLLGVFLLIALILAQSYTAAGRTASSSTYRGTLLALSVGAYLLAIGSKEIALFCVPLFWFVFRNEGRENSRSSSAAIKPTLLYLAAAVAFFAIRARVLGAVTLPVEDPVAANYAILTIPKVLVFYLRQILFPFWLGPAQPIRPVESFGMADIVLPVVISSAAIFLLWRIARRTELQTFGLALFALTLMPALNLSSFGTEHLVHDRYLYLPLAGILIVIIPPIVRFLADRKIPVPRTTVAVAFALIVLTVGIKTLLYNRVWSSNETLWRHAVTIDPGASHAWGHLGSSTANASESLKAFERSLEIRHNAGGLLGKSRALIALGRLDEAVGTARQAIEVDPSQVNAYTLFQAYEAESFALANLRRYDEATTSLKAARQRLPIYYAALTEKLGVVLYTQNLKRETLAELESVRVRARSEFLPASHLVFFRLGMLYAELGRKDDARRALEEFLLLSTNASHAERRQATELLRQLSGR